MLCTRHILLIISLREIKVTVHAGKKKVTSIVKLEHTAELVYYLKLQDCKTDLTYGLNRPSTYLCKTNTDVLLSEVSVFLRIEYGERDNCELLKNKVREYSIKSGCSIRVKQCASGVRSNFSCTRLTATYFIYNCPFHELDIERFLGRFLHLITRFCREKNPITFLYLSLSK